MFHWGLTRWIHGYQEYVCERSICCARNNFNAKDSSRFCIEADGTSSDCGFSCYHDDLFCNNPCCGLICCPIALCIHLITLPAYCCFPIESKWRSWSSSAPTETSHLFQEGFTRRPPEPPTFYYTYRTDITGRYDYSAPRRIMM